MLGNAFRLISTISPPCALQRHYSTVSGVVEALSIEKWLFENDEVNGMRDLTLITFVRTRKAGEEPVCDAVIFDGRVAAH